MKNNKKKLIRNFLIVGIAVVLVGLGSALFIDRFGNGLFKEWFYQRFLIEAELVNGTICYVLYDWEDLKTFIVLVGLVTLVIVGSIVVLIMNRYSSKKESEKEATIAAMQVDAARNEQLLQMEAQRKNDLITYLAHDMRTPLASVIGYLSLLNEAPDMPAEQKAKFVGITLDKATRLELLIEEFFDITRFNLQAIVLNNRRLDLTFLLEQLTDEFYPIAEAAGRKIELYSPEELLVYGDGDKLARVFNNIIKNALSYSYEDSLIKIEAAADKDHVTVRVSSTGEPMSEDQRKQIFEKFFRLDTSRSSKTGGAGLGLAIAKEIMDAHKGSIRVDSDEERTTFTVAWPR